MLNVPRPVLSRVFKKVENKQWTKQFVKSNFSSLVSLFFSAINQSKQFWSIANRNANFLGFSVLSFQTLLSAIYGTFVG